MERHLCQPAEIGQGPSPAVKQFCWHFSVKGTEARSAKGARDSVPWVVLRFSSSDLNTSLGWENPGLWGSSSLLLWTLGEEWWALTPPSITLAGALKHCFLPALRAWEAKPGSAPETPRGQGPCTWSRLPTATGFIPGSAPQRGRWRCHTFMIKGRRESCFYKL